MSVLMKGLSCSTGGDSGLRQTSSSPDRLVTDLALLLSSSSLSMAPGTITRRLMTQEMRNKKFNLKIDYYIPLGLLTDLALLSTTPAPMAPALTWDMAPTKV